MIHVVTLGRDGGQSTTAIDPGSNGDIEGETQGTPTANRFSPSTSFPVKRPLPSVQFQPEYLSRTTCAYHLWFSELVLLTKGMVVTNGIQTGSDEVDA
ncbi:hypothetical protein BFJ63_vAg18747 [Fusarium oxysporum f. sp. narcissi]|uniref:Uncharacterized protein n=1 Tax=Fusarium oxysporum f. sp. narcissi TaxID=451672 RepID=A0A4Q2V0V9_FUSOX|nr:hypothetical protein BFJ63_vAg18747 [Fusarium oxysporum f. sp. narcissi]